MSTRLLITLLIGSALNAPLLAEPPGKNSKTKLSERLLNTIRSEGWKVNSPRRAVKEEDFIRFRSRFCIVQTTVSREAAKDIAEFTDIYLYFFSRIFKGKFMIRDKLKVVVFGHSKEMDSYFRATSKVRIETPYAYYSPSRQESCISLRGRGAKKKFPLETAKHELTHHMLHFYTGQGRIPDWFNEGTACFFERWDPTESLNFNIEKNLIRTKIEDYHVDYIKKYRKSPSFLSPKELMSLSYYQFHPKDDDIERLHYSESWALVNFLLTTKPGRKFFNMILVDLRSGKGLERTMNPKTLNSLERAWYKDLDTRVMPVADKNM